MLYTAKISCKYGGPCDFCKIQVEFPKCPRMTFSAPARPPRENRSHYVQDSSWWSIQCVFSPAYSYSTPSYRVPRTTLGHDTSAYCTTYCKLACLVWDTEKGGPWLPGCQFKGRCSRGRICRAHENGGPAGWSGARARALGFKVVCSQGETTAAQCTGQHRLVPVPGRKPRMVARFACLACFACLDRMHTTDHLFGAGGCCWWLWLPIPHSPIPISPRRPMWSYTGTPQIPRCGQGQVSTGVRSKDMRTVIRRLPVESLQVLQKV